MGFKLVTMSASVLNKLLTKHDWESVLKTFMQMNNYGMAAVLGLRSLIMPGECLNFFLLSSYFSSSLFHFSIAP